MILKKTILLALLVLVAAASATETTWKHSGFEVWGYDTNFTGQYNVTEVRTLEFALNSSAPPLSGTDRAVVYYGSDDKLKVSENGGAYSNLAVTLNEVNASAQITRTQVTGQEGVDTGQNTSIDSKTTLSIVNASGQFGSSAQVTGLDTALNTKVNNSEKDVNSGIPILDASGDILAPGDSLRLTRSSNTIAIIERTSSEIPVRITRVGTNDYTMEVKENGVNRFVNLNNATTIDTGILADASLSENMPRKDTWNNFTNTAGNRFDNGIGVGANASANYGYKAAGIGMRRVYYSEYTGYGSSVFYATRNNNQITTEIANWDGTNWQYLELTNASSAADVLSSTGFPPFKPDSVLVTDTFYGNNLSVKTIKNAGATLGTNLNTSSANFIINGDGSAITVANYGMIKPNVTGVIKYVALMSELQGNITVSLLGDDNGVNTAPPTAVLGGPWSISNGYGYENGSLNIAISDTTRLRYNVSSGDTIQRVTVIAPIRKS